MSASNVVFMFSGQGSQYFQMGKELFETNRTFRNWMVRLDSITREMSDESIIKAMYSGIHSKADIFDRTSLTHPAIFMVEYALAQTVMNAGVWPEIVLGVSLGSFAAAAVAGLIEVEDALAAVLRQASALEEYCEPGGMTAVLADPAIFAEDFLCGRCELAAVNFASHFVISAKEKELKDIELSLRKRNIGYQRLPVSFPFHSQWIDKAKAPFGSFMKSIRRRQGHLRLACCAQVDIVTEISEDFFWNVVRHPIRFRETTLHLERQGVRTYVDLGPAGSLAALLKYVIPATMSTVHALLTPYGCDQKNLNALLASIKN
jgi:bacillaene synthase trans-acting acyltransferase